MLLGGEAFSTKRHAYWNFVGSSRERIEQAKQDWIAGRFPKVPGDEEEFIPFPERPLTRSELGRMEGRTHPVTLASGIELAVWDSGPKDASVLIFLHGFPESHRSWRHQIGISAKDYRCIAPDQRGYGQSSKPQEVESLHRRQAGRPTSSSSPTRWGSSRFTIVGHDWGGAISGRSP